MAANKLYDAHCILWWHVRITQYLMIHESPNGHYRVNSIFVFLYHIVSLSLKIFLLEHTRQTTAEAAVCLRKGTAVLTRPVSVSQNRAIIRRTLLKRLVYLLPIAKLSSLTFVSNGFIIGGITFVFCKNTITL